MKQNFFFTFFLITLSSFQVCSESRPSHGISMHGDLKYKPGQVFDYVNPNAPKGGEFRNSAVGTFDSLNPYVTKGNAPVGLNLITQKLVFETLMVRSRDEPFSLYGLIAKSVEVAPDRSWIIFNLRPEARWPDSTPITAKDVIFSHALLRDKGRPNLQLFYSRVEKTEELGPRRVKFTFKPLEEDGKKVGYDPELPLLISLLSVLPKHVLEKQDFEKISLKPIMGSGPYQVKDFKPGAFITYERRKDYWGAHLPCQKGDFNFDRIRYDYYRDANVNFEAFKAGAYDVRAEALPKRWQEDYQFPAVKKGQVKLLDVKILNQPVGIRGFIINTRRPIFQDRHVREALTYAFDFESLNKTVFYGEFQRTESFYDNTELASTGLPSQEEKEILEPFRSSLPSEIFTHVQTFPQTDGTGNNRENLAKARRLLTQAGWQIQEGTLKNVKTGKPFTFSIVYENPNEEKILQSFARNLKRLGIQARLRRVDSAQYQNLSLNFDYDMIVNSFVNSLSPGREQAYYWGSRFADEKGSRNYPGVKDPVVDQLCEKVATAKDRKTLVNLVRSLDRVLKAGYYMIPWGHSTVGHMAFWDKFGRPADNPNVTVSYTAWWHKDAEKNTHLAGT